MLSTINFCEGATTHFGLGLGTHLFVKVPRPGNSEKIFSVFESSCHMHLLLAYQSNHSKVEAIPLSALPKRTCRPPFSTLSLLNAERQVGKLPTAVIYERVFMRKIKLINIRLKMNLFCKKKL